MIFDNGTYEYIIDDTEKEVGTYILAGDSVLMTPVAYKTLIRTPEGGGFVEDVEFVGESEPKSFVVDADNRTIGELKHKEFVSPAAKEWYMDVTRDEFLKAKASVKSILKK